METGSKILVGQTKLTAHFPWPTIVETDGQLPSVSQPAVTVDLCGGNGPGASIDGSARQRIITADGQ